ncbi:MAG: membrane protein insertase YidC, partial [Myxococcota bacterium]
PLSEPRSEGLPEALAEATRPTPAPASLEEMQLEGGTRWITIGNDAVSLRVNRLGAMLESASLLAFEDRIGEGARPVQLGTLPERGLVSVLLGKGPLREFARAAYDAAERSERSVRLVREAGGLRVERSFVVDPQGYGARMTVRLENRSGAQVSPEFQVLLSDVMRPSGAPDRFQHAGLALLADDSVQRTPFSGIGPPGIFRTLLGRGPWAGDRYPAPVDWVAVESQYFLAAAVAELPREAMGYMGPLGEHAGVVAMAYPAFQVPPGTSVERSYRLYLGPKIPEMLTAVDPELRLSVRAGWQVFRPLVELFEVALKWTYLHVVSNYGVAIILLTILVRLLTYPLTQRSMSSMKRFQEIAPQMKEVQERFKGDKARMQQEVMALYKRTGINPMTALGGGCLPMLLQFPFLIALYYALQASIDLRHAPFIFWIQDLSAPESFLTLAGFPIRPLPLMMGVTMVLQQRLSPSAGVDPQQRQMMTFMSIAFIFLFYQFPAGLVLYWFVSNLLGILQQIRVNRSGTTEGSRKHA